MNWKIGDRAIFVAVKGDSKFPYLYGHQCDLIRFVGEYNGMSRSWECDFGDETRKVNERCLRPIPYDGNNASTWNQCDFKPAIPVEVE